ncbi:MAG: TRAP transporter TatT component family protein [Proteobacteria bacterium]|nr:TRAP transporter TatT component family protein [Pseudomonadota bacterium]
MYLCRFIPMTLLLLCLSNCSIRSMAVQQMAELVNAGVPAFEKDDDLTLIREAIPANIKLLEAMLESDPENQELLTILTQLYASYTFGFIEADFETPGLGDKAMLKDRINRFYLRGIRYGERALLASSASCEQGLKVLTQLDPCLRAMGKADIASLFWYGFNLAAHLNRNLNSMAALAQAPKIEKVMERVLALDESYNFGSAHLFLMAFYGGRSPMMGGNFGKAEEHYQALRRLNGENFLLADVFRARYLLVQKQDQKGFEKTLQEVLTKNPELDKVPRLQLYNSLAKTRAKLYLRSVEDLF